MGRNKSKMEPKIESKTEQILFWFRVQKRLKCRKICFPSKSYVGVNVPSLWCISPYDAFNDNLCVQKCKKWFHLNAGILFLCIDSQTFLKWAKICFGWDFNDSIWHKTQFVPTFYFQYFYILLYFTFMFSKLLCLPQLQVIHWIIICLCFN